jgi:hypothetical protein
MRLNVYPFTLKLMEHRPRLVCFVGKKIWDVYESVAGKTATATATVTASPTGKGTATGTGAITHFDPVTPVTPITPVKLEQAEEVLADLECAPEQGHEDSSPTIVKLEEGIVPGYPPSTPSPSPGRVQPGVQPKPQRRPITPKSIQSAKRTFDWTQPRALRLPLPPSGSARGKATANDVDVEPHSHCYFWVVPSTSGLERTPVSSCLMARFSPALSESPLPAPLSSSAPRSPLPHPARCLSRSDHRNRCPVARRHVADPNQCPDVRPDRAFLSTPSVLPAAQVRCDRCRRRRRFPRYKPRRPRTDNRADPYSRCIQVIRLRRIQSPHLCLSPSGISHLHPHSIPLASRIAASAFASA